MLKNNFSVCAIICEYDPFHSGHKYHIEQAKKLSDCRYVVCLMSGSVTQRATLSVLDKYTRAQHALSHGADLILQLPALYSSGNAQLFAQGAIKILTQLNFVTHLSFGIECDNTLDLSQIAKISEEKNFRQTLIKNCQTGISYPTAMEKTINMKLEQLRLPNITLKPNTILAIEYLKALNIEKSQIIALPVKRSNDYNCTKLTLPHTSSTALRQQISQGNLSEIEKYLPYNIDNFKIDLDDKIYNGILINTLKNTSTEQLKSINSIEEGLEFRILNFAKKSSDLHTIIQKTKSKRYIYSRIKRAILQNYLNITKDLIKKSQDIRVPFKVLGVKKSSIKLLSMLPDSALIKNNDIKNFLNTTQNSIIDIDKKADILFNVCKKFDGDLYFGNELLKI
ncbi:MAG: nucleotidyltransferase family protein [Clostridiales bacterium]|jgi:predicted nucleotidyltransferase|nr:nucleotidyltransferase family protein [Clostridiales bacterium]